VCGVFLNHINHWKLFVPSPPQFKIVYHLHNCRTITKIAQEEPDPLLLKEHFTNLLNYRQLKASFRPVTPRFCHVKAIHVFSFSLSIWSLQAPLYHNFLSLIY